jgi:hypothetical protein
MAKAILILVIGSIFLFGMINYNVTENLLGGTQNAATYYSQVRAKAIANSTVDMLLSRLSDSASIRVTTPVRKHFLGGSCEYVVVDTVIGGEGLIKIAATGYYADESKSVEVLTRSNTDVPQFFKYAALSHGDLGVNGANNTFRDAFNTQWNANIHTNANMILNIPSNFVAKGFATYTSSITANWGNVTISPNQNPSGEQVHRLAPAVSIPNFDPDAYLAKATTVHAGDATYTGTISLGTAANPAIVYVGGKLFIQGTVSGYGIFIVRDDIEITGSMLLSSVDPMNSKVALHTKGKIMINNENSTVHAQMFATNEVVVNAKNANIYGSITTRNKCTFNGEGIKLYYKPANDALTSPFWESPSPRLTALYHYE